MTQWTVLRVGLALLTAGPAVAAGADPQVVRPAVPEAVEPLTSVLRYRSMAGGWRRVRTPEQWAARRAEILTAMQSVMGPLPGDSRRVALEPRVEEEVDCGSYVRRLLTYVAEPGSRVPAYLVIPKAAMRPGAQAVGVLGLHQTHKLGHKVVVGLGPNPDDAYGVELAERGYVCIAPAYPLLANYAPDLGGLGYRSGTMKAIWDNMRALDLLEALPFVRPGRFGAIGHSLGGHNGVFTAVFDERIRVVASSCGLDSFRHYMDGDIRGWTSARYMPALLEHPQGSPPFDFHEVVASLAPRVCFISAPIGDTNFKWWSVGQIRGAAMPVYNLLGAAQNLLAEHPECGHSFPKEMRWTAYRLFDEHLR